MLAPDGSTLYVTGSRAAEDTALQDFTTTNALAVSSDGSAVYVTGESFGTGSRYLTVAYRTDPRCASGETESGPVSCGVHEVIEPAGAGGGSYVNGINCDVIASAEP